MQNEELRNTDYNTPIISELENQSLKDADTVPSPNNPPWNIGAAIGVLVLSILFIFIFPLLFIAPYLAVHKVDFSDGEAMKEFLTNDRMAVILQLLAVIPAHILTIVLAWLVVTKFRKYSFRQTLGWNWGGFKFWHGLIILIFFFALENILTYIFGESKNDFEKILESSRAAVFLVAFLATFTAPLVEEVVYRGILYSSLQRKLGVVWAVIAVTLMFALIHVPQYSTNWIPDVVTVTVILFLSLTLTLIRVKTGNLLPCIALHTVFNGIQSLLLILQPYLENLIKSQEQQTGSIFHFFK